jgi:POLQ-like helicase
MKPERNSYQLLSSTRSRAKMHEYSVPTDAHFPLPQDPALLFSLAIGILGDVSASTTFEDNDQDDRNDFRKQLQFSAYFFDSYLDARLKTDVDNYLLLLGASAYYLCDLPGSSKVLINRIDLERLDLEGAGLEKLMQGLLRGDFAEVTPSSGPLSDLIDAISAHMAEHYRGGTDLSALQSRVNELKLTAHLHGSPRHLLFADICCALVAKRIQNSARTALPKYSGLTVDQWSEVLAKTSFIRELWPAQHLLGKQGVYQGKSAVIQMPTSAGKTKATELIIRSAFLSGRADTVVIIAPFRALCQEIKTSLVDAFADESVYIDDPSDVYLVDFDVNTFLEFGGRKKLLIATPEKFTYLLRQSRELAQAVGLVIYDEGHQFDNGTRGITYELLLSSIRSLIPADSQSVLISAVISNADAIGEWLYGTEGEVVQGSNLLPNHRTVAFASWTDGLGHLQFVNQDNPDELEFSVPRIVEEYELKLRNRETRRRLFPDKEDGKSIAVYLGIKLVSNGSIAVFCGKKSTVARVCELAVDAYERELPYPSPVEYSDNDEVNKLYELHVKHLGQDYSQTQSAKLGIFAHSGNTPQGLRHAIEYAMQQDLIKFVVCTSTLAQGVNLPIRYLIVTSIYQGQDKIKTRDFHNLIGRSGRSGMYTEGTVLFADPVVYDKRNNPEGRRRWRQVTNLFDFSNSEDCVSTLLSLFQPYYSDNRQYMRETNVEDLLIAYLASPATLQAYIDSLSQLNGYSSIGSQVRWKTTILSSVESYLMANGELEADENSEKSVSHLAEGTLAYSQSKDPERELVVQLFNRLATNIRQRVPEPTRRLNYGKTLYGLHSAIQTEDWVRENIQVLESTTDDHELLAALWELLTQRISNEIFGKFESNDDLYEVAKQWLKGTPYHEIHAYLVAKEVRYLAGSQRRRVTLEHVIEICGALAYDGTLALGAVREFVIVTLGEQGARDSLQTRLGDLQKKLKYGVATIQAAIIYEIGFTDRIIASELATLLDITIRSRSGIADAVLRRNEEIRNFLSIYPSYFTDVVLTHIRL